jgi:hypothetical protein
MKDALAILEVKPGLSITYAEVYIPCSTSPFCSTGKIRYSKLKHAPPAWMMPDMHFKDKDELGSLRPFSASYN